MRTTIDLDPQLLVEAKSAALSQGYTLSEVVNEALRMRLAAVQKRPAKPFRVEVFPGKSKQRVTPGLRAGFEWATLARDVQEHDDRDTTGR